MTYAPTTWVDETGTGNGTTVTAALLNRLEAEVARLSALPAGDPAVPTKVASGTTYTIHSGTQVMWTADILVEGEIAVEEFFVEVMS